MSDIEIKTFENLKCWQSCRELRLFIAIEGRDRTDPQMDRNEGLLKSIAGALSGLKIDYDREISAIRRKAWHEYKKDIPL